MATVAQRIKERIAEQPGLTEAELARAIFGADGYQQRLNPSCRLMVAQGEIERLGSGGPSDPFTYRLAEKR